MTDGEAADEADASRAADRDAPGDGETGGRDVPDDPEPLARELLGTIRDSGDPEPYLSALAALDESALDVLRSDRRRALAFWLNCYNAGTQLLLDRRPDLYRSRLRFLRFFRAPCLTVAGTDLGLDDVEQGILRGSRSKYGLGYLPRLFPDGFERRYRLDDPDPRIHFALNCGAESCPAIRVYDAGRVDEQLDRATRSYLDATVAYDADAATVTVPRVFLWYRGDFGGKRGVLELLKRYDTIPADATPRIRHRSWDWSLAAGKFY